MVQRNDVEKIATLARLRLRDDEIDRMVPELSAILDFVKTLSQLDTDSIEPMTTPLDTINRWRDDVPREDLGEVTGSVPAESRPIDGTVTHENLLAAAPDADDDGFLVPSIL